MYTEASGFTCNICSQLRRAKRESHTRSALHVASEKLKNHHAIVFGARAELATYKSLATKDVGFVLVMADAADQAKQGSPIIREGGRAAIQVKKIKQQFIGVFIQGLGYFIYRRLPASVVYVCARVVCVLYVCAQVWYVCLVQLESYTHKQVTAKGANLTATILLDLFSKGHLKNAHTLVLQWDGIIANIVCVCLLTHSETNILLMLATMYYYDNKCLLRYRCQ